MLSTGTTRLLVVDDDARQLRAVERVLRGQQHVDVRFADNGVDAMLQVGLAKPDLIVMDVFMPGLDGIEACRRIKANPETRDVEIVLATAVVAPDLEDVARAAGARCVVSKPFDIKTLVTSVTDQAPPPSEFEVEQTGEFDEAPVGKPVSIRGANLVVKMLVDAGVEVVFGLPGGAISPVHDALDRQRDPRRHDAPRERRDVRGRRLRARDRQARRRRRDVGPRRAQRDDRARVGVVRRPAGAAPRRRGAAPAHGKGVCRTARRTASSSSRWPATSRSSPPRCRARARAASAAPRDRDGDVGPARPGVLTLPMDVTTAQIAAPRIGGVVTMGELVPRRCSRRSPSCSRRRARPLILAGSGVPRRRRAGAAARGRRALRLPGRDDAEGQGRVPRESSARARRARPRRSSARRARYLESGVDVVIAIGTSLGDLATDGFAPRCRRRARSSTSTSTRARSAGATRRPTRSSRRRRAFLGGLAERARRIAPRRARRAASTRHAAAVVATPDGSRRTTRSREIQAILPRDTIFTVDSRRALPVRDALPRDHAARRVPRDDRPRLDGPVDRRRDRRAARAPEPHGRRDLRRRLLRDERVRDRDRGAPSACRSACSCSTTARLGMVEIGHETVYGRRPQYPTDAARRVLGRRAASARRR